MFKVGSWSELISVVLPVLTYLGPYVAHRPHAATKLVRLITVYFEEKQKDPELTQSTHTQNGCFHSVRRDETALLQCFHSFVAFEQKKVFKIARILYAI